MIKSLPFEVCREQAEPLSAQIAVGILRAVQSGYYRTGDRLPNLDDIAESLQVARQTVRVAVNSLSSRGVVVARSKRGIVVLDQHEHTFTHHLLFLLRGGSSYYFSTRNRRLAARLTDSRFRLSTVDLVAQEVSSGLPHVKAILEGNPVNLVMIDGNPESVDRLCQAQQVAYGILGENDDSAAALIIRSDEQPALRQLVARATASGIRRILAVRVHLADQLRAPAAAEGIEVTTVDPPPATDGKPEQVEQAGYALMQELLPQLDFKTDLLYFGDDYVARGGLIALLAAGVRVPGDVRVAIHANHGHCPAFPVTLTRIEKDPMADADVIVEAITQYLRHGQKRREVCLLSTFIPGESL